MSDPVQSALDHIGAAADRGEVVEAVRTFLSELGWSEQWRAPTPTGEVTMYVHTRHAGQVILQTVNVQRRVLGWDLFALANRSNDVAVTLGAVRDLTVSRATMAKLQPVRDLVRDAKGDG